MKWKSFLIISAILIACGTDQQTETSSNSTPPPSGKEIYKTYCVACHGMDGSLQFSGATNLQISKLALEDRVLQITKGKGAMSAFENILSEAEILLVAQYIESLRN